MTSRRLYATSFAAVAIAFVVVALLTWPWPGGKEGPADEGTAVTSRSASEGKMKPTIEVLEARILLDGNPLTTPQIIDNGDSAYSVIGTWTLNAADGYQNDQALNTSNSGTATWTFSGLTPGYQYRISGTWVAGSDRAAEARFTIVDHKYDGAETLLGRVYVDQRVGPNDLDVSGTMWENLGDPYLVRGTTLSIQLSGDASGTVVADAIRVERIGSWVAPAGIPAPDFGIEQSHWMYAEAGYTYDYGSGPEAYRIGANGPYTHYIDNTDPNATDTNNPYGTPDRPRKTLPTTVAAGSVVEIHGGPYTYSIGGRIPVSGSGTAQAPIFIRGADNGTRPQLSKSLEVGYGATSSYFVVENLDLGSFNVVRKSAHHVAIRNCKIHDGGGIIFASWDSSNLHDLVIYNNEIYDQGDWLSTVEDDNHGITINQRIQNAWVLDNVSYHNAGDSVQVNSGSGFSTNHVYIGRNLMFEDGENAVDIKQCYDLVVSENTIFGYDAHKTSSAGEAIVIHYNPERLWFLFNDVSDANLGFVNTGAGDLYLVGNVFHDIHHRESSYNPTSIYAGGLGYHARNAQDSWLINNTFYDVDAGIGVGAVASANLINNIIVNIAESDARHINYIDSNAIQNSEMRYNLVYQAGGDIEINWGGVYNTLAAFQAGTGKGDGSLSLDPMFIAAAAGNFHLSNSPGQISGAIDAGTSAATYYNLFASQYGISIAQDPDGVSRPQGAGTDMGAYEATDGAGAPDNNAPTVNNLAVSTNEDVAVTGTVSGDDADGDSLSFAVVAGPSHGTVTMNANGTFTYTPAADWFGADSFTFRASDAVEFSAAGTVTVTVTGVNDAPAAENLTFATTTGVDLSNAVSANDTENDSLTFAVVAQPSHGTVTMNADGTFTYTPADGFTGTDSFTYRAYDGSQYSAAATVTVSVGAPAMELSLSSLDFGTDETELTFTIRNIGSGTLSYSVSSSRGWLTVSPVSGSSTGETDTLTVTVSRAGLAAGTQSGVLTIDAGSAGTRQINVSMIVAEITEQTLIDVGDTWRYFKGTTAPPSDWNDLGFDDAAWLSGASGIGYGDLSYATTLTDMSGNYRTLFVRKSFNIGDPSNVQSLDLAMVYDDGFIAYINGVEVTRSASMGGTPGVPVAYDQEAASSHDEELGEELFSLTIPAGLLQTGENVLSIEVHNVWITSSDLACVPRLEATYSGEGGGNTAPQANNASVSTNEDVGTSGSVSGSDDDGDSLTFAIVSGPSHGSASMNSDGSFTYTPAANWYGSDTFTFRAFDGTDYSGTATVTVTVNPVNDAPDAANDSASGSEDGTITFNVFDNDTDIDGDTLTIAGYTQPDHGTLTHNGNGSFTYTPDANWNGTDSFTYSVSDGHGGTDTATVSLTVSSGNDAPQAGNDTASLAEDATATFGVLGNDTDGDGDTLTIGGFVQPSHGSVVKNANDTFTYTPDENFFGTDSFTYTVSDGNGGTDTAAVAITVTPVNDAPTVANDFAFASEDTATTFNVLGNDSDVDEDSLTISAHAQGDHGSVTHNGSGSFTYTPSANWNGTDSFTYTVSDGHGGSATATVTVTVYAGNDAPDAANDSATVVEDGSATFNVLGNDSDVDGDTVSINSFVQPEHGTVTHNGDGSFTYTPAANFNGSDSFTYVITDGNGRTDSATVSITVTPVNDDPQANTDNISVAEDGTITFNVFDNDTDIDGDSLTISTYAEPDHGTLTHNGDGSFTYTPAANWNGIDGFIYAVSDGHGGIGAAEVGILVSAVNDAPQAGNDSVATDEDTAVTFNVLGNDSDIDGDSLAVASFTQPGHGTLTNNGGGSFTYTPAANYAGADSFTYTVTDGHGGTNTATVSISIGGANDAPQAGNDSVATNEDTAVTFNVLGNDTDGDGDSLTVAAYGQPSHGTVNYNGGGSFTYTPSANWFGTDSFTYTVSDGNGGSSTATVTITVNSVNDGPYAGDDSATGTEDTPLLINVLANDGDVDGDSLTISGYSQGAHGSVVKNANGTFTYTPNTNYNGADSFTYSVSDAHGGSRTATVDVLLAAVNDNPQAQNDAASTSGVTPVLVDALANDSDVDGDTLTVGAFTQASHGSVVKNANGTFTYTPSAGYSGTDSFSYTVSDGHGGTDTATVSLGVGSVNQAPNAANDTATTAEDTAVLIDVLANDVDVNGDALSVVSATQTSHGSLSYVGGGVFRYTPSTNWHGTDGFSYTVSDGNGGSDTATVGIGVSSVNDAPAAGNDSASGNEDTPILISVLSNDTDTDGDLLNVSTFTQPAHGAVTSNGAGVLTYTPAANWYGADSFSYTVSDGNSGTATASVTLTVSAVNDAPQAGNDGTIAGEDTPITINLLANDTDADGDALTIATVGQAAHGTVVNNGDGTVTYTPYANYYGFDAFNYVVSDGHGGIASANVTLYVAPGYDNPVANDDYAVIFAGQSIVISVLDNDTDVDGDALAVYSYAQAAHGTAVNNGDGTFTYTPAAGYSGADSFTYVITDGYGGTDTGTVAFHINSLDASISLITTASDLTRTPEQVYAVRWEDSNFDDAASSVRVQLFHSTDSAWNPTTVEAEDLNAHRFTDMADVAVQGSVARKASLNGTVDDGLWVRLSTLEPGSAHYVYAAVVDELTGEILAWDRSEGRLVIEQPTGACGEVLSTRMPGDFIKSVTQAAEQDDNDKACYVIRWSDAALPAGATIDLKYGANSTYSDATTRFAFGWGAGTSGGDSRGNIAQGIDGSLDGTDGDAFKWFIGDQSRVSRGEGYYMWMVIRDASGNILHTSRSVGRLVIIA